MKALVPQIRPACLLITLGILLQILSASAFAGKYNEVISIGDPMPSFSQLPTVEGKPISSSDLKEDIVILVSMSNNCPFSEGIENDLIAYVDSIKDQSVRVVAMSFNLHRGDKMEAMKVRAKNKGFNFTYLRDQSQDLGRALGTAVTPEFFVFDKNRKLAYTGLMHNSPPMAQGDKVAYPRGEPTEHYLADAVISLQKSKVVKVTETSPFGCSVEYNIDKYEK